MRWARPFITSQCRSGAMPTRSIRQPCGTNTPNLIPASFSMNAPAGAARHASRKPGHGLTRSPVIMPTDPAPTILATHRSRTAGLLPGHTPHHPANSWAGAEGRSTRSGHTHPAAPAAAAALDPQVFHMSAGPSIGRITQRPLVRDTRQREGSGGTNGRRCAWPPTKPALARTAAGLSPPMCQAWDMTGYNDPQVIRDLLTRSTTWAVVGLSENRSRTAYRIAHYLHTELGKHVVPVHPARRSGLRQPGVCDTRRRPQPHPRRRRRLLRQLPAGRRDRRRGHRRRRTGCTSAPCGCRWASSTRRRPPEPQAAGLDVVMDRCPKIEYPKLRPVTEPS